MNYFKILKGRFFKDYPIKLIELSFTFPYSSDKEIKRTQIWENLNKGIFFEDSQRLIPWSTTFLDLDKLAEKRRDSGDRTNWLLGEHAILDGYSCFVEVMKWVFVKSDKPFSEISTSLGFDYEGNKKFLMLKEKLTGLLGAPVELDIEKFGDFDLGVYKWENGNVKIALIGTEVFNCKYSLNVGLI
jgi:hypothetical protein